MNRLLTTGRFIWEHPLNRQARWAALGRFARWQLASRLLDAPIALPFVNDTFLLARRGMSGATGNWYCGLHEPDEMGFTLHVLRPGALFLDIGANIGSYTVLAAGAAGAEVIALEPVPSTFATLARNVAVNGIGARVDHRCAGAATTEGVLRFTRDLDTVNHVVTGNERAATVEVPVVTVDGLCGTRAPVLIKIDVEGYELQVLRGAESTLARAELLAVILEVNGSGLRYGVEDTTLIAAMRGFGFEAFGYDALARRLFRHGSVHGNIIFVRDAALVEARIHAAPSFRLVNRNI